MTVVRKRGRGLSPEKLADLMAGTSLYVIYGIAVPMFPRSDRPHPSPEVYFRRIRSGSLPGVLGGRFGSLTGSGMRSSFQP